MERPLGLPLLLELEFQKFSNLITQLEAINPPWFVFLSKAVYPTGSTAEKVKLYELWSVDPLHLYAAYHYNGADDASVYNFTVWDSDTMTYKNIKQPWADATLNNAARYVLGTAAFRSRVLGTFLVTPAYRVLKRDKYTSEISFPDLKFTMAAMRRNLPALVSATMHERSPRYYSTSAFAHVTQEELDMVDFDVIVNSRLKS